MSGDVRRIIEKYEDGLCLFQDVLLTLALYDVPGEVQEQLEYYENALESAEGDTQDDFVVLAQEDVVLAIRKFM